MNKSRRSLSRRMLLLCGLVSGCGQLPSDSDNDCGDVALSACSTGCVDLTADALNCGACSVTCATGEVCSSSVCTSAAGSGGAIGAGGTSSGGSENGAAPGSGGTASGGDVNTGGGPSGDGWLVGETCYALCASAASDPDEDGWGWEDEASCVVVDSAPYEEGTSCSTSGGTGGAVSTGGASTGGAGTGGTGGSDCGVAPVNPNATTQARKLLCYLYDIYGTSVLSGQQETSWSNPADDISWYVTNVGGKSPAVLGGDYLYPSGTSTRAIAYWNAGGIPMIRYHMGAPPDADSYESSLTETNMAQVLTPGTTEYNSLVSKLNYAAAELQKLEDANVAVLWAPYHEVQPGGWFWWSKGTADQFKQLWIFTYNYLTTTKGLNNLVWLMPFSGSPNSAWYPAKQYLDLAGPDTYGTNPPFTSMYTASRSIIGTTVPIPLHETGVVPQPSTMFPTAAPWVLWNIWSGYQKSNNTLANVQSAYASSYTITRDEVPNLK